MQKMDIMDEIKKKKSKIKKRKHGADLQVLWWPVLNRPPFYSVSNNRYFICFK